MQLASDYIGFVNSDDILLPNALKILKKYINLYPDVDFFFGRLKSIGVFYTVTDHGK